MTELLTNGTVTDLALIALVAIAVIAWNVRWAFERRTERDGDLDEQTERIERAITDQTRDLLDALGEANTTLDAIGEQASEHVRQNANLVTLVDQATTRTGRMSYTPTDLTKRPDA